MDSITFPVTVRGIKGEYNHKSGTHDHITATERKAIKSGLEQGFRKFGTSRKSYEITYQAAALGIVEVTITTIGKDDWGRKTFSKSVAIVYLNETELNPSLAA